MFDIKSRWKARAAFACLCGVSLSLAVTSCGEGYEEDDEFLLDEATLDGTIPADATVVVADADAFVQSGQYAAANFGTYKVVDVDQNIKKTERHGYLHFKVPAALDIHRARLHLFVRNNSSNAADIFSVPGATWTEASINWNNRPTALGAQVATINAAPRGKWVSVDVTATVVAGQELTLAVIPRSSDNFAFSSRETSGAPVLVIEEAPAADPDAGVEEMCDDAGMPKPEPVDAGTPEPVDAGTPAPVDAGTPAPVDAGTPAPVDAGTPAPKDAGTPAPVDAGTPTSFSAEVQPIFNAHCVGCHGANALGGLNLSVNARTALVNVATSCNPSVARVSPGNLLGSSLWLKLADHAAKCGGPMPYSPGLKVINPKDFQTIEKWISEGALDN